MNITVPQLAFYFFSTLAIISAIMVICSKNSVRAVLYLIFTFFCMAGIWMLLESEFLAIVLVLVYVGAVMVLFLFVVMMLDIESSKMENRFVKYWPIGIIVATIMLAMVILIVGNQYFGLNILSAPPAKPADYSDVKSLGTLLYSNYLLPFEIAGVILLVAMIAAIGLTFRGPRHTRTQKPGVQILATKSSRLRVIQMPSEKRE